LKYRWVIDGNWKLILPHLPNMNLNQREVELFDIVADPYETKNRASENLAIVKEPTSQVDMWWPESAARN